jgi:hypothetical protein
MAFELKECTSRLWRKIGMTIKSDKRASVTPTELWNLTEYNIRMSPEMWLRAPNWQVPVL